MLISSENNQVNGDNKGSKLGLTGHAYSYYKSITNYGISHLCCIYFKGC